MSNQLNNEKFQIINQIMKNFQILYTSILQYSNVLSHGLNQSRVKFTINGSETAIIGVL